MMNKLMGFIGSLLILLFLTSVSVSAGEYIEATCAKPQDSETKVFLIDSSGGKQNIIPELGEGEVEFTKKQILYRPKNLIVMFNLENGKLYLNGEHKNGIICKYDNLAALENESVPSASLKVDEGEVIKLLKSIASRLDRIEEMLSK